jgi:hypothetical protein
MQYNSHYSNCSSTNKLHRYGTCQKCMFKDSIMSMPWAQESRKLVMLHTGHRIDNLHNLCGKFTIILTKNTEARRILKLLQFCSCFFLLLCRPFDNVPQEAKDNPLNILAFHKHCILFWDHHRSVLQRHNKHAVTVSLHQTK